MSRYHENKERAKTRNTDPTLTDQSSAKDADINVIVGRFVKTGMVPGAGQEPLYGDFSELPVGLADFIATARSMDTIRTRLPEQLKDKPTHELLALTPEQLRNILTPAETPKPEEKPT